MNNGDGITETANGALRYYSCYRDGSVTSMTHD